MYDSKKKKEINTNPTNPKLDKGLNGVKKSYPNKLVERIKGTTNKYRLTSPNGGSVTLTRSLSKDPINTYTTKEAVKMSMTDKAKK